MDETKHDHLAAEPAASQIIKTETDFDRSDPQALLIAGLGIASIIALIAVILGVQAYFDHITAVATYDQVLAPISEDLKNIRSQETQELNTYKYIDRNHGVVQIPIGRAMELLAKEAAENKLSYFQKPTPVKVPGAPGTNGAAAAGPTGGGAATGPAPGGAGASGDAAPAQAGPPPAAGSGSAKESGKS